MKTKIFVIALIMSVLLISCSSFTWTFLPDESNEEAKTSSYSAADSKQEKAQSNSTGGTDSKQVVSASNAKPKNEYIKFDSYGYDVEGEDLYALAEVLYSSDELYGAYRLYDTLGMDTKTLSDTFFFAEYKMAWTKISIGLDVFFNFTDNPEMYVYFLKNQLPGIFSPISLGSKGPAGGIIFYDKGDYSDGWRFLEAAPSDSPKLEFGYYWIREKSLYPLYINNTRRYNSDDCTQTGIGKGLYNTLSLSIAMKQSSSTGDYVINYCETYRYENNGIIYDDWFIPSKDELNLMYKNLCKNGIGDFSPEFYWSSSESDYEPDYIWVQRFDNYGSKEAYNAGQRSHKYTVRLIRSF